MKRFGSLCFVLLFLVASGPSVLAGEFPTYRLTDESTIEFEASTPLFSFQGRVLDPQGEVRLSPDPPAVEQGTTLTVPVKSIRTGIRARDRDLYELLKADTYPRITFRADSVARVDWNPARILGMESGTDRPRTAVSGTERRRDTSETVPRTLLVHGAFTIKDRTLRMRVPLVYSSTDGGLRLRSRFQLDVRDFGIEPPSLYVMSVNPTVTIRLDLRATRIRSKAPSP